MATPSGILWKHCGCMVRDVSLRRNSTRRRAFRAGWQRWLILFCRAGQIHHSPGDYVAENNCCAVAPPSCGYSGWAGLYVAVLGVDGLLLVGGLAKTGFCSASKLGHSRDARMGAARPNGRSHF